jgi:ribulose-5-phosphate 4-epimerase/fuculose-1-phosphate aldolase
MFIHAAVHRIARKACVLHTHMPYATALTLTGARGLDTTLSQNAMRFHGRVALDANYNGLALDHSEGERIARAMDGVDIAFLGNHGVVVGGPRMGARMRRFLELAAARVARPVSHGSQRKQCLPAAASPP